MINQESLLPWLTSANSSSLDTAGHNMAAMLFVPKNRKSQAEAAEATEIAETEEIPPSIQNRGFPADPRKTIITGISCRPQTGCDKFQTDD
ncbi:hypothetical protein PoB_005293400 [Plakobranchus ocellatus]|uniref:Uncharacterized protein n=1 Tax=Plakobranchus ocellatus TaxID=259542 RepID=A0AAV4C6Y3_9GAST|nr:hypothetical protein PoB_005293400 [Plakobranchus ocellatus]